MSATQTPVRHRDTHADYLDLVREFPLRVLQDDDEHDEAVRIYSRLSARTSPPLTQGENEYVDALLRFIREYETPEPRTPRTPLKRLHYAMEQSGTTKAQLQEILGASRPLVSMILSGERALTVPHIRKLSKHFRVEASHFV